MLWRGRADGVNATLAKLRDYRFALISLKAHSTWKLTNRSWKREVEIIENLISVLKVWQLKNILQGCIELILFINCHRRFKNTPNTLIATHRFNDTLLWVHNCFIFIAKWKCRWTTSTRIHEHVTMSLLHPNCSISFSFENEHTKSVLIFVLPDTIYPIVTQWTALQCH